MKKERGRHKRVGLVLSAGGLRGLYAHTGFMQAVQKADIPFDCMAGCSAGAIIAACHVAGLSPDAIEQEVCKLKRGDFYRPRSWFGLLVALMFRRGRGLTGLSLTDAMMKSLNRAAARPEFLRVPPAAFADRRQSGQRRK